MMKSIVKCLGMIGMAVLLFACHGYQDPALKPDNGGNTGGGNEQEPTPTPPQEEQLEPGVMRIYADKYEMKADGVDVVTFRVVIGTEEGNKEVSDGEQSLVISYEKDGETSKMARFSNTFTTVSPGAYTFTAEYFDGASIFTENEVSVVAMPVESDGPKYRQQVMGVQFTSVYCTGCPALSHSIKTYQETYPNRLVNVSFHQDMQMTDPMTTATSQMYFRSFGEQGLPKFYANMRKSRPSILSSYSEIVEAVEDELKNYSSTCGVAIESQYDPTTREVKITGKLTSVAERVYRYVVMLLEDGIAYDQSGSNEKEYLHNNVLREAWPSDSTIGYYVISDGSAVTPGQEVRIERRPVTLSTAYNAENVRVFFAVLVSADGGNTYTVDNCTTCKLGESIDYQYEGEVDTTNDVLTLSADNTSVKQGETITFSALLNGEEEVSASTTIVNLTTGERAENGLFTPTEVGEQIFIAARQGVISNRITISVAEGEGGSDDGNDDGNQPVPPVTGGKNNLRRHIALYEFTGVGCAMCPDGWVTISSYLSRPKFKDVLHVIAFHSESLGPDPMHLDLTTQLLREYGNMGLPSCLIDMDVAGEINALKASGELSATLDAALTESPAWCGAALSTTWDETTRTGKLTVRVLANEPGTYRIAPFIVEDGVKHQQKMSDGKYKEDYNHRHVVRQMLSTAYTGDLIGKDMQQGEEKRVEYDFTIAEAWNAEKIEFCVAVMNDQTGTIKNTAVVHLGESVDYDLYE